MVGVEGTEGLWLPTADTEAVGVVLKDRVMVVVAEVLGVAVGVDSTLRLLVEERHLEKVGVGVPLPQLVGDGEGGVDPVEDTQAVGVWEALPVEEDVKEVVTVAEVVSEVEEVTLGVELADKL